MTTRSVQKLQNLLASYFTLAGRVNPFAPPVISPIPFQERAEAAGRAGFRGIGFGKDDLEHILLNLTYDDISKILDDNGLVDIEIELLRDWFATGDLRRSSEPHRRFILDAAAILGCRHIKIGATGGGYPEDHMIESFAELCDDAALAGTRVVLEFSPIGRIPDLHSGVAIVEGADRPNGGLLLDLWHVTRTKTSLTEIAAIPRNVLGFVELSDGTLEQQGEYIEETINRRLLCGSGQFDIAGFLSAVAAAGYEGPYGVEILSRENRVLGAVEAARAAFDSATPQFKGCEQI
jgi:sugar phosphate isomerase/epimerase